MQIKEGPLEACFEVRLQRLDDARGCFVKTFARSAFTAAGLEMNLQEEYYSVSRKGVIRGMHFQVPPHAHDKVVYCAKGAVLDVLLDLRRGPHYGSHSTVLLSAEDPVLLFIARGVAHGFESLTDDSLMVYKTSAEYAPAYDCGIRWDSFGCNWTADEPILSERDRSHPAFADFQSPF